MIIELSEEISSDDIKRYTENLKSSQEKIKKDMDKYLEKMGSQIAQKMLKYIVGLPLIFDLNQGFTSKIKSYKVRAINNNRDGLAKLFAQKHDSEVIYDGTTPTVSVDGFKFVFKDAKSSGGNKGNKFERDISNELKSKKIDNDIVKKIVDELDINIEEISEIKDLGHLNSNRTIEIVQGKIVFKGTNTLDDIGEKLSDLDLILNDGRKIHVSVKYGDKLTLLNAGLGTPGKENKKLIDLLEALGIDPDRAIKGFEEYEEGEGEYPKKEDWKEADKEEFKRFLKYSIGADYLYVHNKHVFFIDKDKNEELASNPRNFTIQYPGVGRKRIDIKFETDGFKEVQINIRSKKGGGVWPTHILSDYKLR